jgi:energy-coupling factor transporter transmembrane protein EcfT
MNEDNRSKKNFYGSFSWVIVAAYIFINIGVFVVGTPLGVLMIVLPIINISLILLWFFVRFVYNKANNPLKHSNYIDNKLTEFPRPKYGNDNKLHYTPHVKVATETFSTIDPHSDSEIIFDITIKDYLTPGNVIVFHDEINYGLSKTVKVLSVSHDKDSIKAIFTAPN